jgi:hypothetical protein
MRELLYLYRGRLPAEEFVIREVKDASVKPKSAAKNRSGPPRDQTEVTAVAYPRTA